MDAGMLRPGFPFDREFEGISLFPFRPRETNPAVEGLKITIAVGSTRRPKLEAVREAMGVIVPRLHGDATFEIVGVDVPSGVRHTPLSREDMMKGARQRAETLVRIAREEDKPWEYFAGLEGGIDIIQEGGTRWHPEGRV